jgi:hypothetical protein
MRRMQCEFMRHFRLLRDRVSSCPIRRDAKYRKKWIPNGYGFWLKLCRSLVSVDTCGIWGRCLQVAGAGFSGFEDLEGAKGAETT